VKNGAGNNMLTKTNYIRVRTGVNKIKISS
jgi:hypothetical protein